MMARAIARLLLLACIAALASCGCPKATSPAAKKPTKTASSEKDGGQSLAPWKAPGADSSQDEDEESGANDDSSEDDESKGETESGESTDAAVETPAVEGADATGSSDGNDAAAGESVDGDGEIDIEIEIEDESVGG